MAVSAFSICAGAQERDAFEGEEYRMVYSTRIYGSTRFDTAMQIAQRYMEDSEKEKLQCVIVASGMAFPDALSATYLAKVKGAPILITHSSVDEQVAAFIKENAAENATVYIVGGTGAVSAEMESLLSGLNVKRLAGANRFTTNLEVLKETGVKNGKFIIANAMNYPDALSASAVGLPIMLVSGNSLTAEQKKFVASLDRKGENWEVVPKRPNETEILPVLDADADAVIIGGTGAVSSAMESSLKNEFSSVKRLGGKDRYETSVKVAQEFFAAPTTIAVAYGLNYPDGLCGGVLANYYGCPLIFAAGADYAAAKDYAKKSGTKYTVTFGGPALIPDESLAGIVG